MQNDDDRLKALERKAAKPLKEEEERLREYTVIHEGSEHAELGSEQAYVVQGEKLGREDDFAHARSNSPNPEESHVPSDDGASNSRSTQGTGAAPMESDLPVDQFGRQPAGYDLGNGPGARGAAPGTADGNDTISVGAQTLNGSAPSSPWTPVASGNAPPPVIQTPEFTAASVAGTEDDWISLEINLALQDTDGDETAEITVIGVPKGAMLSAGTDNADGSWTLTEEELEDLQIKPPVNFSGEFELEIELNITESTGASKTFVEKISVSVEAEADYVDIQSSPITTAEDTSVALDISVGLIDVDGSESFVTEIFGVPADASLSAGQLSDSGSWILTPSELEGLALNPGHNNADDIELLVRVTTTDENGSTQATEQSVPVTIVAVADEPIAQANNVIGDEDTPIPLTLQGQLTDQDGSESLSYQITGVPEDASLTAGTDLGWGVWEIAPEDLPNLAFVPPPHFSGDVQLGFVVTSTELEGDQNSVSTPFSIAVTPVADTATAEISDLGGFEDLPIDLNWSIALVDQDGSEKLSVEVTGVPTGGVIVGATQSPDGVWYLDEDQIANASLRPPENYSGSFTLNVTAVTEDANGDTARVSEPQTITIEAIADKPLLSVEDATTNEDGAVAIAISSQLSDLDGSESLAVEIIGVPTEAALNHGERLDNGNYLLSPDDLNNLQLSPPQDYAGDINLQVRAIATDENGSTAVSQSSLTIDVEAIADTPDLIVGDVQANEDQFAPFPLEAVSTDIDGSETFSVLISNLPAGATLSAGETLPNGDVRIQANEIDGLSLKAPQDFSGSFNLTITAESLEPNGDRAVNVKTVRVDVEAIADTPTLEVSNATGNEDQAIPLTIQSSLTDQDGSEDLSITVVGVPKGASLSAGVLNPDGSYSLNADQLENLQLHPPPDFAGQFPLSVTATTKDANGDTASSNETIHVGIAAVADEAEITAAAAAGEEDTEIPLEISAATIDIDDSEFISRLEIRAMPEGASLSQGSEMSPGVWRVPIEDLSKLTITPAPHSDENFELLVVVTTEEISNGDQNTSFHVLPVDVEAVADAPNLGGSSFEATIHADEDSIIPLQISSDLV
ncbi:MAG: hypothetical protein AAF387_16010, partial [Pseudomonadota bacterium]